MRKELFEVIEVCNQYDMETGFVSNGSLFTESAAKQLAGLQVKDIPISLDAPEEELNNWIRGHNARNRTMAGIKQLKRFGNTFSIFIPLPTVS